jgi:hypothetical protein
MLRCETSFERGRAIAVNIAAFTKTTPTSWRFILSTSSPGSTGEQTIQIASAMLVRNVYWAKGPNLSGLLGGKLYPLFNPRKQQWKRHFYWDHTSLVGKTKTGIVTIQVLSINAPCRVMLRENLLFEGRFPLDE